MFYAGSAGCNRLIRYFRMMSVPMTVALITNATKRSAIRRRGLVFLFTSLLLVLCFGFQVYLMDDAWRFLDVNPEAERLLGRPRLRRGDRLERRLDFLCVR